MKNFSLLLLGAALFLGGYLLGGWSETKNVESYQADLTISSKDFDKTISLTPNQKKQLALKHLHLGPEFSIEQRGAIKYLVRDGKTLGGGYHEYSLKDGKIYGQLGAIIELVVDEDGNVDESGGSDFHRSDSHY